MSSVNLRGFDNSWYSPGRSIVWRSIWFLLASPIFRSAWFASSSARCGLLRLFGGTIGSRVVIRHHVNIKYPWNLVIGDDCWIGEQVWIDNLGKVQLGNDVCLSQGTYLCTGNHDWNDPNFGLMIGCINIGDGAWAGAKSILMPGVTLGDGAIVGAGSVVSGKVKAFQIVMGNPAEVVRQRVMRNFTESLHQEISQ